jgi:hypothetical protein
MVYPKVTKACDMTCVMARLDLPSPSEHMVGNVLQARRSRVKLQMRSLDFSIDLSLPAIQ